MRKILIEKPDDCIPGISISVSGFIARDTKVNKAIGMFDSVEEALRAQTYWSEEERDSLLSDYKRHSLPLDIVEIHDYVYRDRGYTDCGLKVLLSKSKKSMAYIRTGLSRRVTKLSDEGKL